MKKSIILTAIILITLVNIALAQQNTNLFVVDHKYQKGSFDIIYPYFKGMNNTAAQDKINKELKIMIDKFIADNNNDTTSEAIVKYKVHHLSPEMISFTVTRYTYTGGAHGASFREGYTYDLNSGERYEFSDLFEFDSSARANINEQITEQIKERGIPIFEPFQGINDRPFFYIADNGQPIIFFQQYEVGPYSVGILEFAVMAKKGN